MKKLIPVSLFAFISLSQIDTAKAQTFNMAVGSDTVIEYTSGATTIDVYNNIIATVDTLRVNWKLIDHYFAPKIALAGFCDNQACIAGMPLMSGSTTTSDPYERNVAGPFKAIFTDTLGASPANSVSWIKVQAVGGTTTRNVVFMLNKSPSGIFSTVREEAKVAVFPNPASGQVTISYEPTAKIRTMAIYDMTGKEVSSMNVTNDHLSSVNVSNLASGIYFIRFVNADGEIVAIKRLTRK